MAADLFDLVMRWAHFLGALIWIGHNYATAVMRPHYVPLTAGDLANPDSPRQKQLLEREHGIFRHASLLTLASGLLMLWHRGWLAGALRLEAGLASIGLGLWIGVIMVLNLWFVLWPNQKRVLGFIRAPLEERLRCSRITFLSARVNTMLSIPLLFLMAASTHGAFVFR